MQKGMHEAFNFPIICYSPQIPLNKPEILKTESGLYVREKKLSIKDSYEAFDTIEIIPSLIRTVERIRKRGIERNKQDEHVDLVIDWMKRWGYLKAERNYRYREIRHHGKLVRVKWGNRSIRVEGFKEELPNNFYGQKVSKFVKEAQKFYHLWKLYSAVANRDLDYLKSVISVIENPELPFEATHTFYFFEQDDVEYKGYTDGIFDEQNPLESYQTAAIDYLSGILETYINNHQLYSSEIKHSKEIDRDVIRFVPGIAFPDLLDALYMQFFILLSENEKKICPVCNTPFVPERKDKKYCSNTCKSTAKSRRYRARRNNII